MKTRDKPQIIIEYDGTEEELSRAWTKALLEVLDSEAKATHRTAMAKRR